MFRRALPALRRTNIMHTQSMLCFKSVRCRGFAAAGADAPDQAGIHRTPIVEKLWKQRVTQEGRLDAPLSVDSTGLAAWPPSHSRLTVDYNFSGDVTLRER